MEPRGHATASALGGAVASGQPSRRRRRRSRIRLAFYLLLIGVASLITYLVLFFFNALPTMKLQGPRRVNALPASPVLAEAAGARAPRATPIESPERPSGLTPPPLVVRDLDPDPTGPRLDARPVSGRRHLRRRSA